MQQMPNHHEAQHTVAQLSIKHAQTKSCTVGAAASNQSLACCSISCMLAVQLTRLSRTVLNYMQGHYMQGNCLRQHHQTACQLQTLTPELHYILQPSSNSCTAAAPAAAAGLQDAASTAAATALHLNTADQQAAAPCRCCWAAGCWSHVSPCTSSCGYCPAAGCGGGGIGGCACCCGGIGGCC